MSDAGLVGVEVNAVVGVALLLPGVARLLRGEAVARHAVLLRVHLLLVALRLLLIPLLGLLIPLRGLLVLRRLLVALIGLLRPVLWLLLVRYLRLRGLLVVGHAVGGWVRCRGRLLVLSPHLERDAAGRSRHAILLCLRLLVRGVDAGLLRWLGLRLRPSICAVAARLRGVTVAWPRGRGCLRARLLLLRHLGPRGSCWLFACAKKLLEDAHFWGRRGGRRRHREALRRNSKVSTRDAVRRDISCSAAVETSRRRC